VTRAVEPVVRRQVLLTRELRDAVRRERPSLRVLRRRAVALSVDGAAGRAEDDLRVARTRRLQHRDRPEHVHRRVVLRPVDRDAHVDLSRKVTAQLGPRLFEDLGQPFANVVHDEAHRLGDVLSLAVREVVDDRHLVAARQQRMNDVRADEARAPCHDSPHCLIS
jgi:hypothetical protein